MKIEVRLFATLRDYVPTHSEKGVVCMDVPDNSSIVDVLTELGIPVAMAFLVLVDGRYESDRHRKLSDGCVLSIWPPIAGG